MEHGTGAIRTPEDPRDFKYGQEIGFATEPFDWEKGYDAEKDFKLKVKNQNGSFACGGFAVSSYAEMLFGLEKSPKFIYAPIKAPGGGSAIHPLMSRVKDVGACDEKYCISFPDGNPPTEAHMVNDITEEAIENAGKYKTLAYAFVGKSFNEMAKAIRDNQGMILGITGQDNGTWHSAFPKPPTLGSSGYWNHWVFALKAKTINGKKYIGFLNSWGNVGDNGIQWVGEEWLNWLWGMSTMVIFKEPVSTFKFTKDLWLGVTDNEVKELQKYLNSNGFPVAQTGPGSKGNETNYFGVLTKNALVRFQKTHKISPSIGYFGSITRKFINK